MRRSWALLLAAAFGCAPSLDFHTVDEKIATPDASAPVDASTRHDARSVDASLPDAASTPDAATPDAAPMPDAASTPDASTPDAAPIPDATPDATPDAMLSHALDPLLSVPPDDAPVCTIPGSSGECPAVHMCRFFDTESGRCGTCTECRGVDQYCDRSSDCDILFVCYDHRCASPCLLGTYWCGPIEDCWDIGHPTYGVCAPF